jgi:MarR family transcriptional regulator, transcriptional regulator for hemolysin
MSFDLKRQLVAQLVESSRLLRNYIDHRAKTRGTTRAISLVRLLDRLVEHGLLERRHDPKDRRANRLFLTTRGRQLVDDLDSLRDTIATDVLQEVPTDAIRTTLQTLRDVKDRIKGLSDPPGHIAAK